VSTPIKISLYDDCPPSDVERKRRELPEAVGAPVEIVLMQRSMELVACHLCDKRLPGLEAVTDNDCIEGTEIGEPMHATIFCSEVCRKQHDEIGHPEDSP
jgi:hypothetical protein